MRSFPKDFASQCSREDRHLSITWPGLIGFPIILDDAHASFSPSPWLSLSSSSQTFHSLLNHTPFVLSSTIPTAGPNAASVKLTLHPQPPPSLYLTRSPVHPQCRQQWLAGVLIAACSSPFVVLIVRRRCRRTIRAMLSLAMAELTYRHQYRTRSVIAAASLQVAK